MTYPTTSSADGIWTLKKVRRAVLGDNWPSVVTGIQATGGVISNTTIGGINYRIHTFTSSGTFDITSGSGDADVLIVGAGGSGGGASAASSGGGGGGGVLQETVTVTESQSYSIVIGDGGNSTSATDVQGNDGSDSSAFGFTAIGGGGGGGAQSNSAGRTGGSGGGGGESSGSGGQGTTGQGNDGQSGSEGGNYSGGGGGAGESASGNGPGGDGLDFPNLFGTTFGENGYFAGGGCGGDFNTSGSPGGLGGGGDSNFGNGGSDGNDGLPNTGGGGGGGGGVGGEPGSGGAGGSGVVIIRYPAPSNAVFIEYDFSTNVLDQFIQRDISSGGLDGNISSWTYNSSNNSITPPNSNDTEVAVIDIISQMQSFNAVSIEADMINTTQDDDGIGVVLIDDTFSTAYVLVVDDSSRNEGISSISIPGDMNSASQITQWNRSLSNTNFLRLYYDGSVLTGTHNDGSSISANVSFNVGYAGVFTGFQNPPCDFTRINVSFF